MIHSHDFRKRKDSLSDNVTPDKHNDHPSRQSSLLPTQTGPDAVLQRWHNRLSLLERNAYSRGNLDGGLIK